MPPPARPNPFASARLEYRAIRPADLSVFLAINDDRLGYQNSNFSNNKLPSESDAAKFMKDVAEESLLGAIIWLPFPADLSTSDKEQEISEKRSNGEVAEPWGTAIGEVHLSAMDKHLAHHRWTEIGLDILPAYQGQGYGGETIAWVLQYAFQRAGLHRVRIRAFTWNTGAIRLYEKLGFKHEGRERECFWHEGRWWDCVTLAMLEGEWRDLAKQKQEIAEAS